MEGMIEIAEDIFQMPVRRGVPTAHHASSGGHAAVTLAEGGFASMIGDPKFATGVGLVLYGAAHDPLVEEAAPRGKAVHTSERPGTLSRFTSWVRDMF